MKNLIRLIKKQVKTLLQLCMRSKTSKLSLFELFMANTTLKGTENSLNLFFFVIKHFYVPTNPVTRLMSRSLHNYSLNIEPMLIEFKEKSDK